MFLKDQRFSLGQVTLHNAVSVGLSVHPFVSPFVHPAGQPSVRSSDRPSDYIIWELRAVFALLPLPNRP